MDSADWINAVFEQLAKEIIRNDTVSIRGLGTFRHAVKPERNYFHPGEKKIMTAASRPRVQFVISTSLDADFRDYMAKKQNRTPDASL